MGDSYKFLSCKLSDTVTLFAEVHPATANNNWSDIKHPRGEFKLVQYKDDNKAVYVTFDLNKLDDLEKFIEQVKDESYGLNH